MSNDDLNPAGSGAETLPASTPEYAPAVQVVVEDVPEGETHTVEVETPSLAPLPDNSPYTPPREPEPQEPSAIPDTPIAPGTPSTPQTPLTQTTPMTPMMPASPVMPTAPVAPVTPVTPTTPISPIAPVSPVPPVLPAEASAASAGALHTPVFPAAYSPEKRLYELLLEEFSRDPRFELRSNLHALMQDVQTIKTMTQHSVGSTGNENDLAAIRETVEKIWLHLESEREKAKGESDANQSSIVNRQSSMELIAETRALVRSVNEEVNATRNSVIQLTNQGRMMLDVTTRCLREMDKTARKYEQGEQAGETNPLLDELRSLRDMLADGFENARLEPILPDPGELFRYSDHRADNGFASSGKIKRVVFPGFRWTQPTPPVVLLPAVVETEL